MACNQYDVFISATDLGSATGNTNTNFNGKVYADYYDCNGSPLTDDFTVTGTFQLSTCVDDNIDIVTLYYIENNGVVISTLSYSIFIGDCTGPTPTPTVTPTNTQTPTNTPSNTPTPSITPTCFYIGKFLYSSIDCANACSEILQVDLYSNFSPITIGSVLYSDACTTPVVDGYYNLVSPTESSVLGCYTVSGGSGAIISYSVCGPTPTPTQTNTETPTQTPTNTETPTNTPTPTVTPSEPYDIYLFEECGNPSNQFRFENVPGILSVGDVYSITGPYFNGIATVITYSAIGTIYPSVGSVFIGQGACPTPTPTNTSTPTTTPTTTPTPTNTETPTNTPTYTETPSSTPTPTPTPFACDYSQFCFYTTLPSLSGYSGNYTAGSTYNGFPSYSGDGTSAGVIYYYTATTTTYWCLSNGLGGTCYLTGASPCESECPDISANGFTSGICPTPTPTAVNCSIFDFMAYFDCDWEPLPTPTPSIACDVVNFTFDTIGVTPTPTPTGFNCNNVGISFSMSGYTPAVTPTVTLTPSVTLTRTVNASGQATFQMLDETFTCVSVKVLTDCQSGQEYYVTNSLVYSGVPVVTGMTMLVDIAGGLHCVTYTSDNDNISSNANVSEIYQLYSICANCNVYPTPTPTVTTTSTFTPTPTNTMTPTNTSTNSPTPSTTATIGSTPPPTPDQTPTQTPTQTTTPTLTPTPSTTPNYVYVYESCDPISPNTLKTQVIQDVKSSLATTEGQYFKVNGICWDYIGKFNTGYVAPPTVFPITYNTDFFAGYTSDVYNDCASCQVCTRPSTATISISLFYAIRYTIGSNTVVFTNSFSDACYAKANYVLGSGMDGSSGKVTSISVGQTVYVNNETTNCALISNGYYIMMPDGGTLEFPPLNTAIIVHIVGGVITEILTC